MLSGMLRSVRQVVSEVCAEHVSARNLTSFREAFESACSRIRPHTSGDEAFAAKSFQVMDEDFAIIERQQTVIDRGLPLATAAISADDATLIRARRVVDRESA
jgi:hypothetical protein